MCLRCGCNGRHLKADGSCLCGCPSLVTKWEVIAETPDEKPAPGKKVVPLEQLKDPAE